MPGAESPKSSLRGILIGRLVWPLALLILASTVPNYYLAAYSANKAYDDGLLSPALAISNHIFRDEGKITVDLPPIVFDALRVDSLDEVFVQVRGPNNEVIAGNIRLPALSRPITPGGRLFYDASVNNERLRVAALHVPHPGGGVIVQAAETYGKRDIIVAEILLAFLFSELLVAAAAVALLWHGIGRGLLPLERLRNDIASRSLRDLSPVIADDKPAEVLPIVAAINQLLGRLKAAIEGQQRFIANAAHQLRTPLAGLKTHGELALRQPSTVELRSILEMMADETERTSHLVNQLLSLARAEPEGIANTRHNPLNLREIAGRAVQDWVSRAVAKNIDIGFELQDAWTYGEPLLLRELLANLLDNALAYTPSGGTVTVRTQERDGIAVMEVEDSGRGIEQAERERVFERFYRAKGTPGEGCGLGLSIVREITNRHGGQVRIETPANRRGILVRIELPLLRREPLSHELAKNAAA